MEAWVTPAAVIFAVAVIFHSGMITQRVVHLEEWRSELRHDIDGIFSSLRAIQSDIAKKGSD